MGLFKNTLLGAGAAIVSVGAAVAADLPVRKAAPVEYVRVCDAYGRGFFFIPGTDTCIRIGGRLRADYSFVPAQDIFRSPTQLGEWADSQHVVGWEARARISFDVRTRTSWGVVQAVGQMRMARTTGVVAASVGNTSGGGGAGSTLEAAYIRFAGFTFGAARDNFAMMPSLTYGAGHWGSFANGAKQIAYTHSFGGGFSATIALQDYQDTGLGGRDATLAGVNDAFGSAVRLNPYYVYNSIPQINGRLEWSQAWGSVTVAGAVAHVNYNNARNANTGGGGAVVGDLYDVDKTVWAVGGALKLELPMLARGSALWLHAAYADGMTEYTTNWTSFKSSAYRRDVGGYTMNHPSFVFEQGPNRLETVKSWNIAALLQHFWAPQWRSVLWGSYGQLDAPTATAARQWDGNRNFGDATVWNIGTNLAWLPTRDFEIGVEVIYARVDQDIRLTNNGLVRRVSDDSITGRLRVERNF